MASVPQTGDGRSLMLSCHPHSLGQRLYESLSSLCMRALSAFPHLGNPVAVPVVYTTRFSLPYTVSCISALRAPFFILHSMLRENEADSRCDVCGQCQQIITKSWVVVLFKERKGGKEG